ncbi:MAG: hypothetical protein GF388_07365 [Candidatus Aegiribacteria sp.]|nr:hypothetical protein [Candidatus Aegiribacteria sp.]
METTGIAQEQTGWISIKAKKLTVILLLLCFVSFGATRLIRIWSSDEEYLVTHFEDDAYFYLTIARNVINNDQLSFDGINSTNGFHPLWLASIVTIFGSSDNSITAMKMTGSMSVVLMVLAGLLGLMYIKNRYSILTTIICTLLLLRYVRDFSAMSMETSLLLPLLIGGLVVLDGFVINDRPRRYLLLGIMMSVIVMTRLDAVLICLLMFMVLILRLKRESEMRTGRAVVLLVSPPALVILFYVLVNVVFFGTAMSVSGSMKSSFLTFNGLFARQLFLLSDPLGLRSPWGLYLLFLILALISCSVYVLKRIKHQEVNGIWKSPASLSVSIFIVLFTLGYLFNSNWRLWAWYSYPAVLFTVFGLPPILRWTGRTIDKHLKITFWNPNTNVPAVFAGVGLLILSAIWGYSYPKPTSDNFRCMNMAIANQLNNELDPEAIVAMGDRAGSFSYFFDGHVVQMEGLVGNSIMLKFIEKGNLEGFLNSMGVDYVLSYTGPADVTDYEEWGLLVPNSAQSAMKPNTLYVNSNNEIHRWNSGANTVMMWDWTQ